MWAIEISPIASRPMEIAARISGTRSGWPGTRRGSQIERPCPRAGMAFAANDAMKPEDEDDAVQQEVRNAARALAAAIAGLRQGTLSQPDAGLKPPRPK